MKYRKIIITILILALLWLLKGQLHRLGPEVGSGNSEMAKYMYLVESSFSPKLITRVDTGDQKLVALTFDDGPDPRFTPRDLDILKKYHVRATFFVVGQSAQKYPDIIKREITEGNEVENHTYTHPDLKLDGQIRTEKEIERCGQTIRALTGRQPHYFRPPKGLFKAGTIEIAERQGYKTVLWTICVEHHAAKTPKDMAQRVIDAAKPGTIILAHDGRLDRTKTTEALPRIIAGYQAKGYRFVTLDELMAHRVDNSL